jgi:hypothetical protein
MSRLSGAYELGRSAGVCAATGQPFAPGDPCVVALSEAADLDHADAGTPAGLPLRRSEWSLAAWDQGRRPEGVFCFWRTTFEPGDRARRMLVDDETLLDLFHRMDGDERPQRVAFRFVLMLLLVRKRLLRVAGHRREVARPGGAAADGPPSQPGESWPRENGPREIWLVTPRGSDPLAPPIRVVNPELREEDTREIAEQLGEIMQGGG